MRRVALCGSVALFLAASARADVKMPAIFGDHMVLQQALRLPVWGWAEPGEKVTVTFGATSAAVTAGADGAWKVELPKQSATGSANVLAIEGKNKVVFQDVLVGDVWVASGQSNMEFGVQTAAGGADAVAKADDPQLRMFFVPWATALEPQKDIARGQPAGEQNGKWVVCTPEAMKATWGWHGITAIGYQFAREIREKTGKPVGLIATYKGGTPAQSWTSVAALATEPSLSGYVEDHRKLVDGYAAAKEAFPGKEAAYRAQLAKWDKANGKAAPQAPTPPDGGYNPGGNLFNGMVAPLAPYGIKGVIWYQGESNANTTVDAVQYGTLFPLMISDWRKQWGQGDFPFLWVELAGYNASRVPEDGYWPWLRESQRKTLALPGTGMASAVDIGDPKNIHPADKFDVGHRLALVARKVAYGEDIVATGPTYKSMRAEGDKIRISFASASGLTVGAPPWTPDGTAPATPTKVTGFVVAGADGKFVDADAVIEGEEVVVSSSGVTAPAAVRYGWSDCPRGDLYNAAKLPAEPFRTDDWEAGPIHNLAIKPSEGDPRWQAKFKGNVDRVKGKKIDLIFDGDSITDWFQTTGKKVWEKYYGGRAATDFAIAGDQTGHVLWRLQHGQVDGLDPKLVVLLIGTNNTIRDNSGQIVEGIQACANEYLTRCPNAHVVLLNVFPRRTLEDPLRAKVGQVDEKLAKVAWGDRVTFLDLNSVWLDDEKAIRLDLMPGRLHPSEAGYEAWAAAMEPVISKYVPAGEKR